MLRLPWYLPIFLPPTYLPPTSYYLIGIGRSGTFLYLVRGRTASQEGRHVLYLEVAVAPHASLPTR